jgi:hypothetical protein
LLTVKYLIIPAGKRRYFSPASIPVMILLSIGLALAALLALAAARRIPQGKLAPIPVRVNQSRKAGS